MPRSTVVVPVHDKAHLTRACLEAIVPELPATADFEVVVVDDASRDSTPKLLEGYRDRIRVVSHPTNTGFARACNDGVASGAGEFVIFLNNDTIPEPGWLEALVDHADRHPRAAVVGSKLLFPDDTVQHAGVVICQDRVPRHVYAGFPADHPAVNRSRAFQIVTAASALVRREAFESVGGFDEAYRNGYEDVDLCLRLGEAGWEVHYCCESVVYHLESASRDLRSAQERRNLELYLDRWSDRVEPDDFHYYLADGLLKPHYWAAYPLNLSVSPQFATIVDDARDREANRLLDQRSRQVFRLLKQNIRLSAARMAASEPARDGPEKGNGGRPGGPARFPPPQGGGSTATSASRRTPSRMGGAPSARILHEGVVHSPSGASTDRLVSVLIPVKEGATHLRELLPRVLGQDIDRSLEIIAVDSGSSDDSVEVLRGSGATILGIRPASFDHGLTRNLAARHSTGDVLVFVNQDVVPGDESWLRNLIAPLDADPRLAGVCSRVLPRPEADPLTARDTLRDPNGSAERSVRRIDDAERYARLSHHELRLFVNFHTLSAAIRSSVLSEIPFRSVRRIGEDIQWAKDVLEAGYAIRHEPSSIVHHSHDYTIFELLQRNYDDGASNREIVRRRFDLDELEPAILGAARRDWRYLESQSHLNDEALERWRIVAVARRTAQFVGQWLGVNADATADPGSLLSATSSTRAGLGRARRPGPSHAAPRDRGAARDRDA